MNKAQVEPGKAQPEIREEVIIQWDIHKTVT